MVERFGKLHTIHDSGLFLAIPLVDTISYIIDIRERALRGQQIEADQLVESLSAALREDGDTLLSEQEFAELASALENLRLLRNQGVTDDIEKEIARVGQLSETFASRRMDASISKALTGKDIDQL